MLTANSTDFLSDFLNIVYPPILVTVSVLGNLFVLIVYSQEKFNKLHNLNVWRSMSIVDIFCVAQILKHFLHYAFNYDIHMENPFLCKLVSYMSHFGAISAWLRAYITIDLFCSIVLVRFKIRFRKFQILVVILIFALNLIFYSQRFYFTSIESLNNSNQYCGDNGLVRQDTGIGYVDVFLWIDLINSTIAPFIIMSILSVLLSFAIFKSRRNLRNGLTARSQKQVIKRDIQFSITLVALNLTFIALYLPVHVYFFIGESDIWYTITVSMFYSAYAINPFIYFAFNSMFRNEFLKCFFNSF